MPGPMSGVRVVELGLWVAGPACGGILADWGAEVFKVEPHAGDPFRSMEWLYGDQGNPPFDLDNRGKKSVVIDLQTPRGMELMHSLLGSADVFVTNFRPGGLERLGLDYPTLASKYPTLVYASVTGLSLRGSETDRQSYDIGAFWARAGIASALSSGSSEPPVQRGGMGDHMTGMSAAAGVSAALFHREKSGSGQLVEASLIRLGTYMLGWDHNVTAVTGVDTEARSRLRQPNPLINCYRCSDGEWLWMLGLEGDRHWPQVVKALDEEGWYNEPKFSTIENRLENAEFLTTKIDEVMSGKTRSEWGQIFDQNDVWWAPVQSTLEVLNDPQARAAGCFVEVPTPDGQTVEMVATPIDFSETKWTVSSASPELGQDTELVLMELGIGWNQIEELKSLGVIP